MTIPRTCVASVRINVIQPMTDKHNDMGYELVKTYSSKPTNSSEMRDS